MKSTILTLIACILFGSLQAQDLAQKVKQQTSFAISIKKPGNSAKTFPLNLSEGKLTSKANLPLDITFEVIEKSDAVELQIAIKATENTYFSLSGQIQIPETTYEQSYLYLPGFWYRKNLRSPENAPSARVSKNWIVREDRLSTPMTAIFDTLNKVGYSLLRTDELHHIALTTHQTGEVVLGGETDLGALGFGENEGKGFLSFAYPYAEAPHSYYRKLTLGDPVTSFLYLKKGEQVNLSYQLRKGSFEDYADFVAQQWTTSFDEMKPQPLNQQLFSDQEIKSTLTQFFKSSYVEAGDLKGFSGIHLRTDACEIRPILEIGFIGRVLLNAFNALEFAEANQDQELIQIARSTLDSYENHGFTASGMIRELVDYEKNEELDIYSIRRQSEGLYAMLFYLKYERERGRKHPQYEEQIKKLLDKLVSLQNPDGSFPRKFNGAGKIIDPTGGSSPSAVLPLVMAHHYFNDKKYLEVARSVAKYQEKEIISKSDYFSSTLDADCEDKEASLYAATAMYYLAQVTKGKERAHYVSLAKKSAYFTLSWYYTWDVPFAQGQMLGDIGLKSRGWGNVSVENNHIDVFIFEFDEVLHWLAAETGETRFADFAQVIRSSMREQLLPREGAMMGIAKEGYYPEVVQHTAWDYGKNGKGYYNDIFAPGWTVASIWELLTDKRTEAFFQNKK